MGTSLYDLSVPTFLQTVRSVGGFLDRAATHFSNTGVDPDNFVNTRLFDDMAPFHFQIRFLGRNRLWPEMPVFQGVSGPGTRGGTAHARMRMCSVCAAYAQIGGTAPSSVCEL